MRWNLSKLTLVTPAARCRRDPPDERSRNQAGRTRKADALALLAPAVTGSAALNGPCCGSVGRHRDRRRCAGAVGLPPESTPNFGGVLALSHARHHPRLVTQRAEADARPVTVWAAPWTAPPLIWLADHPDLGALDVTRRIWARASSLLKNHNADGTAAGCCNGVCFHASTKISLTFYTTDSETCRAWVYRGRGRLAAAGNMSLESSGNCSHQGRAPLATSSPSRCEAAPEPSILA